MTPIHLVDVYADTSLMAIPFLYDLLAERDPAANISHHEMPSYEEHRSFVEWKPYKAWYLIYLGEDRIGSVYLTDKDEIGISLLKGYHGNGYGKQAVYLLMQMHPAKRYLANIAPGNSRSIAMFEKLGFVFRQLTLVKDS